MTPDILSFRRALVLVATMTAFVLLINASSQIYDSNFVFLWEATSLLSGDRPYRDFFEWGAPLSAYLSAGAQLLVGYRLIGEFLLHWVFIVAGVTLSFDLGARLSRSIGASLAVMPMVWLILATTPTYHYSKLFVFPAAVWLAWNHIERPRVVSGAALGAATALAFLFRHDYVLYVGWISILALAVGWWSRGPANGFGRSGREAMACAAVALVCVAPWAVAVARTEGLAEYTRLRAAKYEGTSSVFLSMQMLNPLRVVKPAAPPTPQPAVIGFFWQPDISEQRQHDIEQQLGLRRLDERDSVGRLQYAVNNLYDVKLLSLDPYILDGNGFVWERLTELRARLPSRDDILLWLEQVTLLVPLMILVWAAVDAVGGVARAGTVSADSWRMILVSAFLIVIDYALLRERSYFVIVAPLTMAIGARFLAAHPEGTRGALGARLGYARRVTALVLLLLTTYAAGVWARLTPMFNPSGLPARLKDAGVALVSSPPATHEPRYLHLRACTSPGDHILITGLTPFDISYYAERPVAGGHLYWHSRWGADPASEQRSLALLRRQSVPFAVSVTPDRVLEDLEAYPRVHDYIAANYREVEGSNGMLLVDTRRRPTGTYGDSALPCFR